MGNSALGALGFILGTIFSLYAMLMALRFVMQTLGADYYNPLAQFVVKATDPLVVPLRRVLPSVGKYDTSSLALTFVVLLIKLGTFKLLSLGAVPAFGHNIAAQALGANIIAVALIDMIYLFFNIFIFAIVIQAILSWIPNQGTSPVQSLLYSITSPVLNPIRRILPPMGGLDLSAFVGIIGLIAVRMFVVGSLSALL